MPEAIPLPYNVVIPIFEMLPQRIRERRERQRLTLEQAAKQARVATTTFHRWEHGGGRGFATPFHLMIWLASFEPTNVAPISDMDTPLLTCTHADVAKYLRIPKETYLQRYLRGISQ